MRSSVSASSVTWRMRGACAWAEIPRPGPNGPSRGARLGVENYGAGSARQESPRCRIGRARPEADRHVDRDHLDVAELGEARRHRHEQVVAIEAPVDEGDRGP